MCIHILTGIFNLSGGRLQRHECRARREEGKVLVLGSRDGLGLRIKITLSFLRSSLHDIPTHPCSALQDSEDRSLKRLLGITRQYC